MGRLSWVAQVMKKKKNFVFGKVDKLKRFQKARRYIFMYIL